MAEVLTAVEVALAITEVVKLLYGYISCVKDAKEDIQKLTQELFALKGALEHFDLDRRTEIDKNMQGQVDGMLEMTQDTLSSIQSRLRQPKSTMGKIARSLSWPFKSGEIAKHLDSIERAKTWFIMVILKDSSTTTIAIYNEMKKLVEVLHEDIINKQTTKMMRETSEMLTWLAPVNAEEMLKKATKNKIPGTGRWFLDHAFSSWLEPKDVKQPFMWINGKSGSGKTVLFSTIVDELQSLCSTALSTSAFGYHCCSLDDASSQQISNIFGSAFAQVGAARPEILHHIAPYKRSDTSLGLVRQNNLTIQQIHEIIAHILQSYDRLYILVDALNETPHQQELVQALVELCETHEKLRVLVTCTREPFLLTTSPLIKLRKMRVRAVDLDIEAYVLHRLESEACFRALSLKMQGEIQQKIVSEADGMFRWAKLCMDRLSVLRTGRDIRDALHDMPTTLNETYVGILDRIPEHDRDIAREALLWLCFSLRPLSLDELAEAVVLRESDSYIDDDCRLTNPLIILDICRDLAVRDEYFVTLAHDSIRSFLTSPHIRNSSAAFFAIDADSANSSILRKCLSYLRLDVFASGPIASITQYHVRLGTHPLINYASTYWPTHSERYPLPPEDESFILSFFATKDLSNGSSFDSWVQILLETDSLEPIRRTQPLYYAASFNMLSVLKILLQPKLGVDLDRSGGRFGSTALFVAIWRGNVEAAKLLIEAGADPEKLDGEDTGHPTSSRELAETMGATKLLDVMKGKTTEDLEQ
ncbi:Fc.00g086820.m01.CDS01 [Cosmosporella sp. VM-42]